MDYKYLKHTADIKFQAFGNTIEDAFSSAAYALKEVITDKEKIKNIEQKNIKITGKNIERLLYDFLEEFLFLLDAENFIFSKIKNIKIDIKNFILEATVMGDFNSKYNFVNSVKAITYNEMFVKKEKDKYIIQVVIDV
jgi:SHS2 domain-containing protein